MPRVHTVQKARKDQPEHGISKGDTYYWWKFRNSGKQVSKQYPTKSQLTQSDFLQSVYELENSIGCFTWASVEEEVEDLIEELSELVETCRESLENMPEHLQESSPTGEILQERIDNLEMWVDGLLNIDYSHLEETRERYLNLRHSDDSESIEEAREELSSAFDDVISEIEGSNPGF